METLFVAYYRVSTKKQGISHLGLDAQKQVVLQFVANNGNKLIAQFIEIESGRNNNRPELMKAINFAKENNGTLIIAKLDRLSRNVHFISALMESKVNFVCCDMPDASPLTIHIFSALAEWERQRISERTKSALQAKKQKNPSWKPGTNNLTDEGRMKSLKTRARNACSSLANRHAWHYARSLREIGTSYETIARKLNMEGYRTRTGKLFHPVQVWSVCKRFNQETK